VTGPDFTPLLPTVLMRHRLAGVEQANPVPAGVIEALDAGRDDPTADHLAEEDLGVVQRGAALPRQRPPAMEGGVAEASPRQGGQSILGRSASMEAFASP